MGQRYTDQELAQSRAKDTRDDHAHARIDELHKLLEQALSDLAVHGKATDTAVVKGMLAEADKRAERRVGLR